MKISKDILSRIKQDIIDQISQTKTEDQLENIRISFLGRQGTIASLMKELKTLSLEEKKEFGPLLNILKQEGEKLYQNKKESFLHQQEEKKHLQLKYFDVTAYKPHQLQGSLHPYTLITQQVEDIFISMGYEIADGPEVETEYYNFEALNFPPNHPARDIQDTFWLANSSRALRSQTSTIQARAMEVRKPPIALIAPGRCYRYEATDASHDFMFSQVEGLYIGKNVSLSNLIATLKSFLQIMFDSKNLTLRVRPGFFPFVEPGVEIDFSCPFCKNGCSTCKYSTWIELVPGGLVHPNVLKFGGIDPKKYSGFAFGLGLTRLAMLKYGIHDVRLLHDNALEFLTQF